MCSVVPCRLCAGCMYMATRVLGCSALDPAITGIGHLQTSNLAIRHAKRTSAVVQTHAPRPLGAAEGVPVLGSAIGGWNNCGTIDLPQGGGWETPALVILTEIAEIDHLQTSNCVRYSAVQRGTECGTARCSAVQCVTVRYSAIQCDKVRYRVRYRW